MGEYVALRDYRVNMDDDLARLTRRRMGPRVSVGIRIRIQGEEHGRGRERERGLFY